MTEAGNTLSDDTVRKLKALLAAHENRGLSFEEEVRENLPGMRPPVRFITKVPYSTYIIRTYPSSEYDYAGSDLDGDSRSGQEYVVMVDGETPVPVSLMHFDPDGNHKQMISFVGDDINGEIKLILNGAETTPISLVPSILSVDYLTAKLEVLPAIGKGNLSVSIWPGRWLVEFVGKLAGVTFDQFEVDHIETAVFKVHVYVTNWADSHEDDEVIYPIPLAGEYDGDDNVINDAVAAGSFGTADPWPGVGLVVNVNECRDYNGDGTPNL